MIQDIEDLNKELEKQHQLHESVNQNNAQLAQNLIKMQEQKGNEVMQAQ